MRLKPLLNYLLKEQVEEGIRNTSYAPTPFNMREFKALDEQYEMREYVEDRLQRIGEGSSRTVFILSPRFALKLANLDDDGYDDGSAATDSEKGIAQNEAEFNTYMEAKDSNIIPKVQDYHPGFLWLIVELVRPIKNEREFKKLTGFDEFDMLSIVDAIRHDELTGNEHSNPLIKGMIDLARNHNISPSDMYSVRQWGKTSDGRVVLLDTGATYDILENMYETE